MQPLDLVSALPWQRVVFTTYALSLSFFEAVVLDRLVRGGGRNALILADPEGIRAGLSEQGARRAGRDYELEPVACWPGVFHPKLSLFFTDDDAHLLVGSGNLTFGGWGMNLETVDHLHPSFAAEAFDDAADLFEALAIADTIRTGVSDQFEPIAAALRRATTGAPRGGNFRLLHSVGGSIAEQLAALAADLGGATRLSVVAPYFDTNGGTVASLAGLLECDDVRLHVHPAGPVRGPMGTNWPVATAATPVCVDAPFGDDDRHLHAKCFEILCRRGRLVMSGSANATHAALFSGNVEASLVRLQRNTLIGWDARPAAKPVSLPPVEEGEGDDAEERVGILRAVLEGDRVVGQAIVPRLRGEARLSVAMTAGFADLGTIDIDADGKFEAAAPNLEMQSWTGGRIVLRVEQNGKALEGLVSIAAAAKIMQKAGPLAPRLLAMLAGTETPEDVAAILTWFKEDPDRIASTVPGGGHAGGKLERKATWVSIEELRAAGEYHASGGSPGEGEPAWQRALWLVRSAFAEPRGPWKSGTGEDDQAEDEEDRESESERQKRLRREEDARQRAMKALDGLLDEMLADRHQGRHAASAFALAHYLADRIRPAPLQVGAWLSRVLGDFARHGVSLDAPVATAGVLMRATDGQSRTAERSRRYLLQAGIDPLSFTPEPQSIPGFIGVLGSAWEAEQFLDQVRLARTAGEEVRAYLEVAGSGKPAPSLPGLKNSPHWPKLANALADPEARSRLQVLDEIRKACPRCNLVLPTSAYEELQQTGVTSHCRTILCRGI